jgi:GNAT superfamily N-acetyltransferase
MPTVRRLQPNEWRIYRDLRLRTLAEDPEAFGSTLEHEQSHPDTRWAARLGTPDRDALDEPLVARHAGAPIGLAWARVERARPERADLYQMWVAPESRGLGAGWLLLQTAISWSQRVGAEYLALGVTCGSTSANRLYARAGFLPIGDPQPLRAGSSELAQELRLPLNLDPA